MSNDDSLDPPILATWDPYDALVTLPVHSDGPGVAETSRASCVQHGLCADCLFKAMQKGKEPNTKIQEALSRSQRAYLETGYKELENLTHETYALRSSACSWYVL